jgi:hypothetical protein
MAGTSLALGTEILVNHGFLAGISMPQHLRKIKEALGDWMKQVNYRRSLNLLT